MDGLMDGFLRVIFQIAGFLLLQTVLLNLLEHTRYEKYIRTFSGFLLILLLVSALLSLAGQGNLLAEIAARVEYAGENSDYRMQLVQAEESQTVLLQQEYEVRILLEAEQFLAEERFFLVEGSVVFAEDWEISSIRLLLSRTWPGEDESGDAGLVAEVEPVKVEEVGIASPEAGSENTDTSEEAPSQELVSLQERLAARLGIASEKLHLDQQPEEWPEDETE